MNEELRKAIEKGKAIHAEIVQTENLEYERMQEWIEIHKAHNINLFRFELKRHLPAWTHHALLPGKYIDEDICEIILPLAPLGEMRFRGQRQSKDAYEWQRTEVRSTYTGDWAAEGNTKDPTHFLLMVGMLADLHERRQKKEES